jgi:hypothetical protein
MGKCHRFELCLQMKTWIKAFGIACIAEFPLLIGLATTNYEKFVSRVLTMYHMFAISLAFSVLQVIWNRQPWSKTASTPDAAVFFLVFAFQALLTTPIVFLILTWVRRARTARRVNSDHS